MAFFTSAVGVLQTLVIALGAGLGIWGVVNLMEGYGNDNPGAKAEGKKSFFLDSKAPTGDFEAFLRGEVRYASLEHEFPDVAKELFKKTKEDAMARRALYERLDAE